MVAEDSDEQVDQKVNEDPESVAEIGQEASGADRLDPADPEGLAARLAEALTPLLVPSGGPGADAAR